MTTNDILTARAGEFGLELVIDEDGFTPIFVGPYGHYDLFTTRSVMVVRRFLDEYGRHLRYDLTYRELFLGEALAAMERRPKWKIPALALRARREAEKGAA